MLECLAFSLVTAAVGPWAMMDSRLAPSPDIQGSPLCRRSGRSVARAGSVTILTDITFAMPTLAPRPDAGRNERDNRRAR